MKIHIQFLFLIILMFSTVNLCLANDYELLTQALGKGDSDSAMTIIRAFEKEQLNYPAAKQGGGSSSFSNTVFL